MKTVSRFNSLVPAIAVLVIALPLVAMAAGSAQDLLTPVAQNLLALVKILVLIAFVLAIAAFGWGIVRFIFAAGDPAATKTAKSFLLWGVIGMAVMASLFGLINFLQRYFGVAEGGLSVEAPKVQ